MNKGIITDNKVYCPKCKKCNYNLTSDYKLVEINNKKYTEFVARCLEEKCGEKFYFQSDVKLEKTTHYSFDRKDEKEIKEPENKDVNKL